MASEMICVVTTLEKRTDAEKLAARLVEQKLAACVQISSCASVYSWKGQIVQEEEFKLTVKTARELYDRVESCIVSEHPYEIPELIAFTVDFCSSNYKNWLMNELRLS